MTCTDDIFGKRNTGTVSRGEITPMDPAFVIEAVLDPPYFHLLITGQPVTDDFLVRTVDLVVNGLT